MNQSEEHSISIQEQKSKIRERYRGVDPNTLECLPARPPENIYDENRELRVAVYARVSTDDPRQTSSYELQKNHYTDFVNRHPNWKLVEIYADEGISGTSLNHRESFLRMIEDCYRGKIDMIITKSVSRFARNIMDCIGYVRQLKELKPPIGIRFEAEGIFTLDANSEMTLSFMAAMAQEESHNKSEIMNASIEMRFKRGIFLKPPLLGYDVNEDGELIINEEEAKTVRLIFFMYLYGYTCQQIADQLTALKRPTKKGNLIWNPGSILQILQNERHCGDIIARKTWTPNYLNHKSKKNKQDRNQYRRYGDHEAIISKDDFVAVQHLILNAKYGAKGLLPELHVISDGVLKGFVAVNPRWAGFKAPDYNAACRSVYEGNDSIDSALTPDVAPGDFDLRGFEITRAQFLNPRDKPYILITHKLLKFNLIALQKFQNIDYIELLIHTVEGLLAIRPSTKEKRNCMKWSRLSDIKKVPKGIGSAAFIPTLYELCGWNPKYTYRCLGQFHQKGEEMVLVFNLKEPEVFIPTSEDRNSNDTQPRSDYFGSSSKSLLAYPADWRHTFGNNFYHQSQAAEMAAFSQSREWNTQNEGVPYHTEHLNVTPPDKAREEIHQIIQDITQEEPYERVTDR